MYGAGAGWTIGRVLLCGRILLVFFACLRCGCAEASDSADNAAFDRLFTTVADVPLGKPTNRFDYQSFDRTTGRLYIAEMGSAKLLVFDVRSLTLVAELDGFPKVTGVLAVPGMRKVYASVPGAGIGASVAVALGIAGLSSGSGGVAVLNSASMSEIIRLPGGVFPDGLAYDPDDRKVAVSDELGGAVEIIDAKADTVADRIDVGGEVGNVQYDPITKMIYAPVQSRDTLAMIDPGADDVSARLSLPCRHPHGLQIAAGAPIAYVACDESDQLLIVDLVGRKVLGSEPLGHDPDVLSADPEAHRLYVASESGTLSVFDTADPAAPRKLDDVFVGADAHSVAVDPASHRLFLPLRNLDGKAVLRILDPGNR